MDGGGDTLTGAAVGKMKVAELRAELSKRGLDTSGKKQVLVDRLLERVDPEAYFDPARRSKANMQRDRFMKL